MTTQPFLRGVFGLGGWEIILILGVMLVMALVAAALVGVVFIISRKSGGKNAAAPPVISPSAPGSGR